MYINNIPFLLDTDSYKCGHYLMYPDAQEMTAYLTFRKPLTNKDHRIIWFGSQFIQNLFARRITQADIDEVDAYLAHHGVAGQAFQWPRELWQSIVDELDGVLPFKIMALPDGTVTYPGVPCVTITALGKYARLVTWFETKIMRIWSVVTTATKSRHIREYLEQKFIETVGPDKFFLLDSRLHDFGSRGVSSAETAATTGIGHLLSFNGTDTMVAGALATKLAGRPVGESVFATEHSVMTSWDSELHAVQHLVEVVPEGSIVSCVADSYDYEAFLNEVLPNIANRVKERNLLFVVRPDSGNPLHCVLLALEACSKYFGYTTNSKGYRVLNNSAVIQGDGLDIDMIKQIADAVQTAGYSAECVAYGMGGGLLQKQTRDTLSAAIKLMHITYADGTTRNVMKNPTGDANKVSLPGWVTVNRVGRELKVYPVNPSWEDTTIFANLLKPIWDCGKETPPMRSFTEAQDYLNKNYHKYPLTCDILSNQMKAKIEETKLNA